MFHEGNSKATKGKGICHLQTDVTAAHNEHRTNGVRGKIVLYLETVFHRMQEKDSWQIQALYVRTARPRTRCQHQPIIGELMELFRSIDDGYLVFARINRLCCMLQEQVNACIRNLCLRAVSKLMVIRYFPTQIKRQATDAVVGESVLHNERDACRRVQFSGSQCGADARIAAADNDQV